MSAVKIEVKQEPQLTKVSVDGKHCYHTVSNAEAEAQHIKILCDKLDIENIKIEVK